MPKTCCNKFRLRYVFIAPLLLAFIIIGIILSGYTAQNGINLTANAAVPSQYTNLLTNRGLNIYDTVPFRGTHTYDNLLTSHDHSYTDDTSYGDFIFNNINNIHVSTQVTDQGFPALKYANVPKGQNRSYDSSNPSTYDTYEHMGFMYNNPDEVPENASIVVNVPILSGSNLFKAINDPMLNVRIHAYANMLNMGTGDGTDYASATITYNNGTQSTPVSKSRTVSFPESPYSDRDYEYTMSESITLSECHDGAYIQYTLDNFDKRGANYVMNISKFAFRITISVTNFTFKDPQPSDIKVIDADGTRDSMATADMVKRGDIIFISTQLQINDSYLSVNTGVAGDTNDAGRFYRNLMLNAELGTARTSTKYLPGTDYLMEGVPTYTNNDMVTWQYDKVALTRIYSFTDENGVYHDLTSGYDALQAAFYVNDSTRDTVHIKCSMRDAYGTVILGENDIQGTNSGRLFSYVIDSQLPNAPYLDTSSVFYQKYITNKDYYTKISGYNRVLDSYGSSQIESVTIGTPQEGSDATVSSQTTSLQGLSGEIVYYRVTRLEREPNHYTAEPFTKEQATGIYCLTQPTLSLVNDRYVITGQNTIYQGMTLMLRQGDSPENYTYPKQGIYKVEFITYDYVGNISPNSSAVIIRVDVSDYQFEVVTQIGSTVTTLEDNSFNLVYYALNDNNVLEPRSNATFKRGDRIVLQLDFTTTGYTKYILTMFRTPAGYELNTSEFPYDNNFAVFLTNTAQSTAIPTFTLSNNYAGDEKAHNRKLILTFKRRAQIAVSNDMPIYEPGVPKTVNTIASIDGKRVTNITIETTYSETKDGPYRGVSENFPVNAGEYYYRCVINSSDYYGFVSGTMTIVKATPVISELRISPIEYGDSLAIRDTVFNTSLNRFVMSDTIFCSYTYFDEISGTNKKISVSNRSSDGVYGYFSIADPLSGSNNYLKPSAGTMKVRIVFTPIIMEDQYTPKYGPEGNFIINNNYRSVTVSDVNLIVNHSTNVQMMVSGINEEGQVITEYTGSPQNISVDIRANDDGRTLILNDYIIYTFTNLDTGITNAVVPTSAGRYAVNYSLNKNLCNYTGNWTQEFIIDKRKLLVICDDITSEFQREVRPSATAKYYYSGGSTDYYGLNYDISYYFYNDITKTKAEIAVEQNLVPNTQEFMFNNIPWVAGRYVARITINETNFTNENDCLIVYTINKVTALDNPYLTAEYPHLNWTTSTSGYHIDYLQPLKAISIATNQNTYLQYSYHYMDLGKVKYSWQKIQGKFIVAKERYIGDYSPQSVDDFVETQREYAGLNAGQHSLYLYFVPDHENLPNFNLLDISCTINVGKAKPIFSDIEASAITYGTRVQSIDDITLSKDAANKKAVKFKLYNDPELGMQYYYLPEDQYTFSLFTTSTPVLPAGNNNVIITFNPLDTNNFMKDNGTVSVTVNKKTLDIDFAQNANYDEQSNCYIYPYKAYQNSQRVLKTSQLVNASDNPQGAYTYYIFDLNNEDNNYKGERYLDSTLIVGKYIVEYTINDNNYQGSNYYTVEIIKDSVRRTADPIISLAATAVSYGKLMSAVSFSGGSMLSIATGQKIEGAYHFNYEPGTVFDKMGTQSLKLRFVPHDTHNYNIYEGNESGDYRITVNVSRADISADLTLDVPENLVYGDVAHDWDFEGVSYTAPIYTNGEVFATSKIDETYRFIDGVFSINNRPMTGYFNAGVYDVTFTVKEDSQVQIYYKGSVTVSMRIAKQKAVMVVEENQKTFDNKRQGATVGVFLAIVEGETVTQGPRLSESVTQVFYKNGIRLANMPLEIGEYTVEIFLQSLNYEYVYGQTLTSSFTIKVDEKQIIINNLNQVYSLPRPLGVSLGINNAVYTLRYYDSITETEYSVMPINAGSYDVHLVFDAASNNGYQATVVYKDKLVIEKYTAQILTSEVISTVYTGKPYLISVRTEPYNLPFSVTYRKQGEEEFTPVETLEANTGDGYHEVKFFINSANYKGEKIIKYYIIPAQLTIGSHPVFDSYTYNTDIQPSVLAQGEVRFGYDKIIENGLYEIPLESIKYLDTGTYIVNYNFTAYNELGQVDTNYKVATGRTTINIVKQEIDGQNIIIPDDVPLSVQFNNSYHYVYAVFCKNDGLCDCHSYYDASNIDKDGLIYNINSNNKDLRIRIRYNGISDPALSRGEYIISAYIESKNYTGSVVFDKKLVVEKGVPEVRVKPSVATNVDLEIKKAGDSYVYPTLTSDDIIGGEAFIKNTSIRIGGFFTIIAGQQLNKANINLVRILFTPDDSQNFNAVEVTIVVNVVGINPIKNSDGQPVAKDADWTDLVFACNVDGQSFANVKIVAEASGASCYGAKLSDFELRFINEHNGAQNNDYAQIGHLVFVQPNYVPDVGELVAVKFIPFEESYGKWYNEMYGMLRVSVEKADAPQSFSYNLIAFDSKSLNEDMVFEILDDGKKIDLKGGSLTIYTDESKTVLFDLSSKIEYKQGQDTVVYIVYKSTNYCDIEGYAKVNIYNRIMEVEINVEFFTKEYTEEHGITVSDLAPTTNVIGIDYEDIKLEIRDSQGNISDGKNIGTYSIVLTIDTGEYYGQKEIAEFTVVKKDISSEISLDRYSSTYNNVILPTVMYKGSALNASYYTLLYKQANLSDGDYLQTIGEDAQSYHVKVSVNSENYYGDKVFTYVIEPIKVRIIAYNREVVFGSVESMSAPPVEFRSATSEDTLTFAYTLYYYNDNYTMTTVKPSDAGVYTVRCVINDTNYIGNGTYPYHEFTYTITSAPVMIFTAPIILSETQNNVTYNIKYGQALSDIKMQGGEARRNNVPVAGAFSIINASYRPDAGNYTISILFTPYNSNYASAQTTAQIVVAKGQAQVIVDNLHAKYNGISKKDWINVSVQPSGVQVRIVYTNSKGDIIPEPTNAGTYFIHAVSLNDNYNVAISTSEDGSMTPRLVIAKAKVQMINGVYNVRPPEALSISAGDSLAKSSLTQKPGYGEVYYEGFSQPINGSFSYLQSGLIFNNAGVYETGYIFTPSDINNFDTYTGIVTIMVNKAFATISVTNTNFVYGEGFSMPKFTTSPVGLSYDWGLQPNQPYVEFVEYDPSLPYNPNHVIPAGTYQCRVWITSPNYNRAENYLDFTIYVAKKNIDLSFVDQNGEVVTQYVTTYGVPLNADIKLYSENNSEGKRGYLLKDEIVNNAKIGETRYTRYVSTELGKHYDSHVAPKERGTYEVSVSIINDNYTASGTIMYVINRGIIEEVIFDTDTLENQIYGSGVVPPHIYTRPSNISYYIVYQGYNTTMPKDAGSYNIMVYFNDDNFDKKQVSAMFKINPKKISVDRITVKDKVYDGVATVEIDGKLRDVELGDQVRLTMKAATLNNDASIGRHSVVITEYSISGLQASNYILEKPVVHDQINIFAKVISAPKSKSYVTSPTGFRPGTTVEFNELDVKENKTNIFTKAMGVESTVVGFTIKENGAEAIMKDMVKVYVAIPKQYLDTEFEVKPAGNLAGQTLLTNREGNYITFYTTNSGSIVFEKKEFQYGLVVAVVSITIIVIGIIVLFALNPMHSRAKTSDTSREKAIIKRIRRGY